MPRPINQNILEMANREIRQRKISEGIHLVGGASVAVTNAIAGALRTKTVWINPGHGLRENGATPGTSGVLDGRTYLEREVALEISLHMKQILENHGITVHMSHTNLNDALPNSNRGAPINAASPGAVVSVHLDSHSTPEPRGILVFHSIPSTSDSHRSVSERLANAILQTFRESNSELFTKSNRVDPVRQHMNYFLFNNTNGVRYPVPIALLELGFMSNPSELRYILDNTFQIASNVSDGIINFLLGR